MFPIDSVSCIETVSQCVITYHLWEINLPHLVLKKAI